MQDRNENEVDLLDFLAYFYAKKRVLLYLAIVFGVLFAFLFFYLKPYYKAVVSLLPTENSSNNLSALSGLISLAGGPVQGAVAPSEKLIAIFESRTVAEKVIQKNKDAIFSQRYPNNWKNGSWHSDEGVLEPAVQRIATSFVEESISVGLELPLIRLEVVGVDPKLVHQIALDYLAIAQDIINSNDLTVAQRNSSFLEDQVEKMRASVLQGKQGLLNYYSNINNQSQSLQNGVSPQVYLDFLEDAQDVSKQINLSLEKNYVLAKIDAEKEKLGFTVLDAPIIPERPYFPNRVVFLVLYFVSIFTAYVTFVLVGFTWSLRKNDWKRLQEVASRSV